MIRSDVIKDYKEKIDTSKEMAEVLSTIRDNLLKHYCTLKGWSEEEAIRLIETVLKLNKEIRHYQMIGDLEENQRLRDIEQLKGHR